jgi:hypothetical protein
MSKLTNDIILLIMKRRRQTNNETITTVQTTSYSYQPVIINMFIGGYVVPQIMFVPVVNNVCTNYTIQKKPKKIKKHNDLHASNSTEIIYRYDAKRNTILTPRTVYINNKLKHISSGILLGSGYWLFHKSKNINNDHVNISVKYFKYVNGKRIFNINKFAINDWIKHNKEPRKGFFHKQSGSTSYQLWYINSQIEILYGTFEIISRFKYYKNRKNES